MRRPTALLAFLGLSLSIACGSPPVESDAFVPTGCVDDADCDDGLFCNGTETCDSSSPSANRFGCVTGDAPCGGRACMEGDRECEPECPDADGDGHLAATCGGDDCDDDDPNRYPGNTEVCDADAHDEDCDGSTFGERDLDGDRFFDIDCCNDVGGTMVCGLDCEDTVGTVNPVVPEVCNGFDDNCDGEVDTDCGCSEPGASRACGTERAGVGTCVPGTQTCEGGTWTACTGVLPTENDYLCDGQDEDCDGSVDEGVTITCIEDQDGDGYGDPSATAAVVQCPDPMAGGAPRFGCAAGRTRAENPEDCCDSDARAHPGVTATEWFGTASACGGFDFDCDGTETQRRATNELSWCFATPTCYCRDNCGSGWERPDRDLPPDCGEVESWCTGCALDGATCGRDCEDLTQECR